MDAIKTKDMSLIDRDLADKDIDDMSDEEFFGDKPIPKISRPTSVSEVVESMVDYQHPLIAYAKKQASDAQFPSSTATLVALTSFSATLGLRYCTEYPNGYRMPLGLYFVGEQPPSSAKSRILNVFNQPVQKAVGELNKQRFLQNKEIEIANKGKLKSSTILEDTLPILKVLSGNVTAEALEQKQCAKNRGYFSLASAEQGLINTFLGLTRGNDHKNDNDLLLKGFNGEYHSSDRITRSGYEGLVHGSFCVIAQDGSIDTILQQSNGTGMAERFIFYVEDNLLGQRNFINHQNKVNESDSLVYENAVSRIIKEIDLLPSKAPLLEELEVFSISKAGWIQINKIRQEMEPLIADGGEYSHSIMRGIVGKLDIQVMKLSSTLHGSFYALDPLNTKIPKMVGLHWVELAIKLVWVFIERIYQLLQSMNVIGLTAQEEAVLQLFQSKNRPLNMREIKQNRIKVKPFKEMSSGRSEAVELTVEILKLKNEIHQVNDIKNITVKYSL